MTDKNYILKVGYNVNGYCILIAVNNQEGGDIHAMLITLIW